MTRHVRNIVLLLAAAFFLAVGALMLPTPLPLGAIFFALGLALLLTASPRLQRWFQGLRYRYPGLDSRIATVESYLPEMMRRALNGGRSRRAK